MTAPTPNIAAVDVPLSRLEADMRELVARQRAQAAVERSVTRLQWLLAHPEAVAAGTPASPGEAAEQRHWLYDADEDASTPAFPYPTTPEEAS